MSALAELFNHAVRSHQNGQLDLAEKLYRQILQADPRHARCWHFLGLLARQVGRPDLAVDYIGQALRSSPELVEAHSDLGIALRDQGKLSEAAACCREAIRLKPDFVSAHINLGTFLSEQGLLDEAEACFREALRLQPEFAEVHYNLGNALRDQGKLEEAMVSYHEALRLKPDIAEAQNNLGAVLRNLGKHGEAETCYREALRLKPGYAEAYNNLGNACRDQGKLEEAATCFREALRLKPRYAEAHTNFGVALKDQGRPQEAEACYQEALRLKPGYAEAHNNLGDLFRDQGKLEEAQACLRAALRFKPDSAEAHSNLGNVLRDQGELGEAEACHREALRLKPGYAKAQSNLGVVLQEQGRLEEAEHCQRAALRQNPRLADAWYQLATLQRGRLPAADLDAMRRLHLDPHLTPVMRSALCFGLAQVLDARQEFEEAGEYLVEANALARDQWRQRGQAYDPAAHTRFVDRLLDTFSPAFFERVRGFGVDSERLIFIVGLPRTGTTLVEQILASHSQVFGAGELTVTHDNFLRLADNGTDDGRALDNLKRLEGPAIRALAEWHLDQLRKLDDGAQRVADKLPENYLYLGFLAGLFPRAKFVHCRRDLRDTAVSCWMTHFRAIPWVNDFEPIARRFHDYERVMNHWRQVLPVPLLDVDYEETVANLEGVARRLVSWCGLEWEPACLNFYEGRRPVRTASVAQARQPIFNSSVARWRHYEKSLGPLFAMLPAGHSNRET